jgi:hypothetical protein
MDLLLFESSGPTALRLPTSNSMIHLSLEREVDVLPCHVVWGRAHWLNKDMPLALEVMIDATRMYNPCAFRAIWQQIIRELYQLTDKLIDYYESLKLNSNSYSHLRMSSFSLLILSRGLPTEDTPINYTKHPKVREDPRFFLLALWDCREQQYSQKSGHRQLIINWQSCIHTQARGLELAVDTPGNDWLTTSQANL